MKSFFTSRWGVICIAVAISVIALLFGRYSLLGPIENGLAAFLKPLETASSNFQGRIKNFSEFFSSRKQQADENTRLNERVQALLIENTKLRSSLEDLHTLRDEEQFLTERKYTFVPSHVIARTSFPHDNIVVLDKGTSNGVIVGMPVVVGQGIVVGKIISTTSSTSMMNLVTDSQSEFAVKVQNDSKSLGIVTGSHGLSLTLSLIPQSEPIAQSQSIITSGTEDRVPQGLIIGSVGQITYKEGELFQSSAVVYPISLDNLTVVSIVL